MDAFAYGPRKRSHRSKVVGAIVGFVLAGSLVAVAVWVVIPNSPGLGFGKGKPATQGLALVSLDVQSNDPALSAIGPSDTGSIVARWRNDNTVDVSIVELSYAGGPITRVGDPSCTAPASTFGIATETVPVGTWTVAANGGERLTSAAMTTTSAFPACLAGGLFTVQVLAKAVAA